MNKKQESPLRNVFWIMTHKKDSWRALRELKDVDIALLQETCKPPPDIAKCIELDSVPWSTAKRGNCRTAIGKLSDRVRVKWLEALPLVSTDYGEFGIST